MSWISRPWRASYTGSGSDAYHPRMMTALLFYSYANGIFSSRKIEAATYDSVATLNDKQELEPILEEIDRLPEEIGTPKRITADNGYYSEDNINKATEQELTPYVATGRQKHNQRWTERVTDPGPPPRQASETEQMAWRLKTPEGRDFYGQRKATVETVFGIIKHVIGFRQCSLRGLKKVAGEWNLIKCAYNLKRMHALA